MPRLLRIFGCLAVLPFLAGGTWKLANARGFQVAGELVRRVETPERVVALTFDDGPTAAYAEEVLATLRTHGVRGTFYVTGQEVERHPGAVRRLLEEGHELGNHSYSHRRMVLKSPAFIRTEVERTDSLIRGAGYAGPLTFRPPYGKKLVGLPLYLARTGRTTVMWDVEPDNTESHVTRSPGEIVRHAVDGVRPGSVVLLHVWFESRRTSRQALGPMIEQLRARGYRFVTVSELIAMREGG